MNAEQGILNIQYCDGRREPHGTREKHSLLLEEESVMSDRHTQVSEEEASDRYVPGTPCVLTLTIHHHRQRQVLHMKQRAREAMERDQLHRQQVVE